MSRPDNTTGRREMCEGDAHVILRDPDGDVHRGVSYPYVYL